MLENWPNLQRGYRFGQKTTYSNFHLGLDLIVPTKTKLFAPFDGTIEKFEGNELGKTLLFRPIGKDIVIRCGHLDSFTASGTVKKGTVIALSDQTGTLAGRISHVHLDISKHSLQLHNLANFLDPDKFDWASALTPAPLINIPVLFQQIWFRPAAKGEIAYFQKRLDTGTIADKDDMAIKMDFWFGIVYPVDEQTGMRYYSVKGNVKWQAEKIKVAHLS